MKIFAKIPFGTDSSIIAVWLNLEQLSHSLEQHRGNGFDVQLFYIC